MKAMEIFSLILQKQTNKQNTKGFTEDEQYIYKVEDNHRT